ncbi:MAG: DUF2029 domain-containing protein [Myxococcales bacterium]|nr:DUF2029 domain-containing protein [Myxococcales bacterium]
MDDELRHRLARALTPSLYVALIAAVTTTLITWRYGKDRSGLDFYQQPWAVTFVLRHAPEANPWDESARERMGRRLLDDVGGGSKALIPKGKERQYRAAMAAHPPERQKVAVAGTPFFFAVMSPWSLTSFDTAGRAYLALLFASLAASLLLLGRLAGLGVPASLVLYAVVIACFEPFRSELRVWNVNCLLLAIAAWALWQLDRGRIVGAGATLACGVLFKPTLGATAVTVVIAMVAARRWRSLAQLATGAAIGSIAAFLLGCYWAGRWDAWSSFLQSLGQLSNDAYAMAGGNVSVGRWLLERTGSAQTGFLSFMGVLLVAFFARAVARSRLDSANFNHHHAAAVGLGAILPLLTAPLAWLHYYVLLLLPAVLLLRPPAAFGSRSGAALVLPALGAVSLLICCAWPVWIPIPVEAALAKPFTVNVAAALLAVGMVTLAGVPAAARSATTLPATDASNAEPTGARTVTSSRRRRDPSLSRAQRARRA